MQLLSAVHSLANLYGVTTAADASFTVVATTSAVSFGITGLETHTIGVALVQPAAARASTSTATTAPATGSAAITQTE